MVFLDRRKRRKLLAEMTARRRAEDDLLAPALRTRFDRLISEVAAAPEAELSAFLPEAVKRYAELPLPRRDWLYSLLDLIFVVGAIAFALRGLFFQPFRIPTGSMQPTLFGIHYQSPEGNANPGFGALKGVAHHLLYGSTDARATVAAPGGALTGVEMVSGPIFDRTRFSIGGRNYSLPGNPRQVADYAPLTTEHLWRGGETLGGGYVTLGDHLFVERLSLYFRAPERGDVIVFNTEDLRVEGRPLAEAGGYYYIKRVAALPGDTVKIAADQLWVRPAGRADFVKIQELDDRFRKLYSGRGGYHGHLGGMGTERFAYGEEFTVPAASYLMLGDNSAFSMDSRYFGPVPRRNLIGRAWVVFYPFSRRVGRVDRNAPLAEPTGAPGAATFQVMSKQ